MCRKCNLLKDSWDYYWRNSYKNSLYRNPYCKKCSHLIGSENRREYRKINHHEYTKKHTAQARKWRLNNLEKSRDMQRRYRENARKKLIDYLGGKCKRCAFSDWRALQFDHVNGGGNKERILYKTTAIPMRILKGEVMKTDKYQLLCANCNWIKRYENGETRKIDMILGTKKPKREKK